MFADSFRVSKALVLGAVMATSFSAQAQSPPRVPVQEPRRWQAEAARVTITRDDWGIAHVHGKSDADAVFGMMYAQCEDDFPRIETNYLNALGRLAEAEGEQALWSDLRQRLFIDPAELQQEYKASPAWLQTLMNSWADGINFYLARHRDVHPKVLNHFEPWMALSFTEGSIGGDIERIDLKQLEAFVTGMQAPAVSQSAVLGGEPSGSNGFAIAPGKTLDGHALLLINPHTSFFFRSEQQVTSDAGLNAYGAATWGQFFIYQGFNERAGWMHTSSGVDAVDEFLETVHGTGDHLTAAYGRQERPVERRVIHLAYRGGSRDFTTYRTTHGPVVRSQDGRWVAIKLMQEHVKALQQSYLRTRAHKYAEYQRTMELMANSSNNTVYADADGTIAYWHGNYIPRRDAKLDYTQPVDGADPATDWQGLHPLSEVPQLKNPASGYLFNVNDSPWNGAGVSSLRQADFPAYVEQGTETARGLHAERVLEGKAGWTLESLRAAAYDSYLPWFARTVPLLISAWDKLPADDARRVLLAGPIATLRAWDDRWGTDSIATSMAVFWGTELMRTAGPAAHAAHLPSEDWVAQQATPEQLLAALSVALTRLTDDFKTWRTPWGDINRFERVSSAAEQPFADAEPSLPVPFTSSLWGSLASFGARPYPGTKRWYGTSGNSFVAVVEFGARVQALAVTAGGESGHVGSPHFDDEAQRYAQGNLREVYFYPDQLKGHTERVYRPGR